MTNIKIRVAHILESLLQRSMRISGYYYVLPALRASINSLRWECGTHCSENTDPQEFNRQSRRAPRLT